MARATLTQSFVDRTREEGDYFDTALPNFVLVVHKRSSSYYVHREMNGKSTRRRIARTDVLSLRDARTKAREYIQLMSNGIDPQRVRREQQARQVTLREAFDLHVSLKDLSPRTVGNYESALRLYFGRWASRQLEEIGNDRTGVRQLHETISKKSGRCAANAAMRMLRAVYKTARREYPNLPEPPTDNVTFHKETSRAASAMLPDEFEDWYSKVAAISNPIRRDFQVVVLFTGLRRESAARIRWVDLDLERRSLFIPEPKGGSDRAFTIPLSDFVVEILRGRQAENEMIYPGAEWVFPTRAGRGRQGKLVPIREPRENGLPGPHALRHTYASVAHAAGVSEWNLKCLLNHRAVTNVTHSYVRFYENQLRADQEKITAFFLDHIAALRGVAASNSIERVA